MPVRSPSVSRQICERMEKEVGRGGIEVFDERRIPSRLAEVLGGAEPALLEQLRHLNDGQALAERELPPVDIAARNLVDDIEGVHRTGKAILAGLQLPGAAADHHGGAEQQPITHDAGADQGEDPSLGAHVSLPRTSRKL